MKCPYLLPFPHYVTEADNDVPAGLSKGHVSEATMNNRKRLVETVADTAFSTAIERKENVKIRFHHPERSF